MTLKNDSSFIYKNVSSKQHMKNLRRISSVTRGEPKQTSEGMWGICYHDFATDNLPY